MFKRRGNKPPSVAAKLLLVGIIVLSVLIVYLAFKGFEKEPNGPPAGSSSLPAQAAAGTGTQPTSEATPQ